LSLRATLAVAAAALLPACTTGPAQKPAASQDTVPFQAAAPAPAPNPQKGAVAVEPAPQPPFDGEQRVISDPMRGLASIDRTLAPDDLWQRIQRAVDLT